MAESKLGMSLDSIIEQNRKKFVKERKPKPGPAGGAGAGDGKAAPKGVRVGGRKAILSTALRKKTASKPAQNGGGAPHQQRGGTAGGFRGGSNIASRLGPRDRGIAKRVGLPRRGATTAYVADDARLDAGLRSIEDMLDDDYGVPAQPRPAAVPDTSRRPPGNSDGKWEHDLFDDTAPIRPRREPGPKGAKLFISNLDYNVSEGDVRELFESCGPLQSYKIHFDRSGRSNGTAEVVYQNRADAEKALQKYNNIALDGKKLNIELVGPSSSNVVAKLSSGISVTMLDNGDRPSGAGGASRMLQQGLRGALPRGVGGYGASGGARTGNRLRSGVVKTNRVDLDLMQE